LAPMAWLSAPFTLTAQALCSAIFNSLLLKVNLAQAPILLY
jgi:hypothetical protein